VRNARVHGGKVRVVWVVWRVPGSFAALRMTAGTNNGKGKIKGNGEIQGSLHCAPDVRLSVASVEMTFSLS
jgi:hypothetical protein